MRETWQPIATAPRDGQHILACDEARTFGRDKDGKLWPVWQTVVHWFGDGFYVSVSEQDPQRPFHATHWMPLGVPGQGGTDDHAECPDGGALYDPTATCATCGLPWRSSEHLAPWIAGGHEFVARPAVATPTPEERPDGQ